MFIPHTLSLSDDTYNEICQGQKGYLSQKFKGTVKEILLPNLADTLNYYLLSIQYLLPASNKHFLLVFNNCYLFMLF